MISIKLRYVVIIKKKNGRSYFYWNRPGFPLITLSKYGSPAVVTTDQDISAKLAHPLFVAKVHELNAQADARKTPVGDEGTFRWLVRAYEQSPDFKDLRPRTKQNYRYWLKQLTAWGPMPISVLDDKREGRKLIHALQSKFADRPHMANEVIATLKTVIEWAIRAGHMENNPAKTVRRIKTSARRDVWTAEAEAAFLVSAPPMMALAYLLGAYTGQRQADLLALKWDQIDGGYITFDQQKTAECVTVAIHPKLATALEAIGQHGAHVLMWQEVRPGYPSGWHPFKSDAFKHAFKRATDKAGLTGLQFRDLRRTLLTRLSKAGATPQQLADVSGHKIAHSAKILDTYVARNPGDAVLTLTDSGGDDLEK